MANNPFSSIPKDKYSNKPAPRSSAAILRTRLTLIIILFFFAAAAGPIALVLSLAGNNSSTTTEETQPLAQGFAKAVATYYLGGQALPNSLPIAEGLDPFMGRTTLASEAPAPLVYTDLSFDGFVKPPSTDTRQIELYKFRVTAPEVSFTITVPVVFVSTEGIVAPRPVLAANPTLEPNADVQTGEAPGVDYTSNNFTQVNDNRAALDRVVQSWANTYTTGTAEQLADLAGTNNAAPFVPLRGFTTDTTRVQILSVVQQNSPEYFAVRARLPLIRSDYVSVADYDLLVTDLTVSPKVVAWGPSGSAPNLSDWTLPTTATTVP